MKPEDVRSLDDLKILVCQNEPLKYQFFWGHTPQIPDQIDQSCLSNWFPAKFVVEGVEYSTTEHFMMAEKARLFQDKDILSQILEASSPGAAKSLGRKVSGFEEGIWRKHRFGIVVAGNYAKFSQNAVMGELLRRTGSKILVEASPRDRIWGIGMGQNNENAENPLLWRGINLLGFALMEVRERLAQEA